MDRLFRAAIDTSTFRRGTPPICLEFVALAAGESREVGPIQLEPQIELVDEAPARAEERFRATGDAARADPQGERLRPEIADVEATEQDLERGSALCLDLPRPIGESDGRAVFQPCALDLSEGSLRGLHSYALLKVRAQSRDKRSRPLHQRRQVRFESRLEIRERQCPAFGVARLPVVHGPIQLMTSCRRIAEHRAVSGQLVIRAELASLPSTISTTTTTPAVGSSFSSSQIATPVILSGESGTSMTSCTIRTVLVVVPHGIIDTHSRSKGTARTCEGCGERTQSP